MHTWQKNWKRNTGKRRYRIRRRKENDTTGTVRLVHGPIRHRAGVSVEGQKRCPPSQRQQKMVRSDPGNRKKQTGDSGRGDRRAPERKMRPGPGRLLPHSTHPHPSLPHILPQPALYQSPHVLPKRCFLWEDMGACLFYSFSRILLATDSPLAEACWSPRVTDAPSPMARSPGILVSKSLFTTTLLE